jgi:hypothetical protein
MEIGLWSGLVLGTVVAIALVALFLAVRAVRELRSGMPLDDERSMALKARAGYYASYINMYATLGLGFLFAAFEDEGVSIPNSELLFILVALMGSVQIVLMTYLNRRGRRSAA